MKRFNWVDYTIFGILILAVLILGVKSLSNKIKETKEKEAAAITEEIEGEVVEKVTENNMDRLSVDFLCRNMDLSTAQAVVQSLQGEDLLYGEEPVAPTRIYNSDLILDAEIVAWEILEQEDGTANLLLTIETESEFKIGSYAIGNQQIRVGQDYICKTMTMELIGIINGITVLQGE